MSSCRRLEQGRDRGPYWKEVNLRIVCALQNASLLKQNLPKSASGGQNDSCNDITSLSSGVEESNVEWNMCQPLAEGF